MGAECFVVHCSAVCCGVCLCAELLLYSVGAMKRLLIVLVMFLTVSMFMPVFTDEAFRSKVSFFYYCC